MSLSGLLAGYSIVVEYQTAVISVLLGLYACVAIRRFWPVFIFAVAATLATGLLAVYNYSAFGDPFDFGYAHEVAREFKEVHSAKNPLGVQLPGWDRVGMVLPEILWKPFRGLLFYAPVLCAVPLGFLALLWRRHWGVALVALAALSWMLAVNVSYPLWEGGWCTGPRLIVPAIPFGILLVGGLVGSVRHAGISLAVGLATLGGTILMIGCVAVGGRFPTHVIDPESPRNGARIEAPVTEIVLPAQGTCPLCRRHPSSYLAGGHQFERNAGQWLMELVIPAGGSIPAEPSPWQGLQMVPLATYLILMICVLMLRTGKPEKWQAENAQEKVWKETLRLG
jgi:hypothetical protein